MPPPLEYFLVWRYDVKYEYCTFWTLFDAVNAFRYGEHFKIVYCTVLILRTLQWNAKKLSHEVQYVVKNHIHLKPPSLRVVYTMWKHHTWQFDYF